MTEPNKGATEAIGFLIGDRVMLDVDTSYDVERARKDPLWWKWKSQEPPPLRERLALRVELERGRKR